ncbi:hypothetical protein [uncultured Muribaculum sp.]|uniref:hypothetical protein n=1 Tax=uncultured Muribaculum sp. TaxID=1918613 RepID=UPI00272C675C|nr:hypothetical protein [uncultured Muribaculum sp.]
MALPLNSLLKSVDSKVTELMAIQRRQREQIVRLEKENEDLRTQLSETRAELDNTRKDVEFLTMSHRLADSPDSVISARRRIARLIRTIDNCISMLKEE